ncbi:MAG: hypothetical protein P1P84_19260 [Deferrisomatales bacterium]|nr:hypothetical protein [Deferrisomatales bacterium]
MAYRITHRHSRALADARKRARLEREPPDYPPDLPELRREVLVVDYDAGAPVVHHWVLTKSDRIDCYGVTENGVRWQGKHG